MAYNKIGIIGAMDIEVDALKDALTEKSVTRVSGIDFYSGKLLNKDVVIAKCGVGKVFSAVTAEIMVLKFNVDAIINTGVAGSISTLKIGDLAISSSVVQYDMDTTAIGDPLGLISGINMIYFLADEVLSTKAISVANGLGINTELGVIASGDKFVSDKKIRKHVLDNFGALCVEMEGGAIGHVAYINSVPFVVIRSISDDGDSSHAVEFTTFAKTSAEVSVKVIKGLLQVI
jgi:adenosylhomocysteine nucleosidase